MRFSFMLFAALTPLLAADQPSPIQPSLIKQRIDAAQARVETGTKAWQPYNDLAAALLRQARDTGDPRVYQQAMAALKHSEELSPGNYEARKLEAAALLGEGEYAQALKAATEVNNHSHDDIGGWALLADINMALGNYAEAEKDAQWVLDLRPGSTLGFEKAAALREYFGDFEGAVQFYDEANRRTSANDIDGHAWFMTQKARLILESGDVKAAELVLDEALQQFPGSQFAHLVLAQIREAQGNYADAATIYEQRYRAVPSAANLFDWAEALDLSGEKEQAAKAFQEFENKARAESARPLNANLQLVHYYLDYKDEPAKALTIATQMTAMRHDSPTLEAYAWALYRNGKIADSKVQMDRALAVGVRDAVYFCHAAQIARKSDDQAAAAKFEKEIAVLNGKACPAQLTQSALEVKP